MTATVTLALAVPDMNGMDTARFDEPASTAGTGVGLLAFDEDVIRRRHLARHGNTALTLERIAPNVGYLPPQADVDDAPHGTFRGRRILGSEAVNLSIPASEFVVFSLGPKTA